ncbi:MAG: hypothetical protein AAGF98_00060 [Cyanobacteria bacterium P01_H01_bin.153]
MADMTQLTGEYAASWLPWLMIPLIFYILPFPVFAIIFLWIEHEGGDEAEMNREMGSGFSFLGPQLDVMGAEPTSSEPEIRPTPSPTDAEPPSPEIADKTASAS